MGFGKIVLWAGAGALAATGLGLPALGLAFGAGKATAIYPWMYGAMGGLAMKGVAPKKSSHDTKAELDKALEEWKRATGWDQMRTKMHRGKSLRVEALGFTVVDCAHLGT